MKRFTLLGMAALASLSLTVAAPALADSDNNPSLTAATADAGAGPGKAGASSPKSMLVVQDSDAGKGGARIDTSGFQRFDVGTASGATKAS